MAGEFMLMLLLGLAGSLHCVQMCGPLVLSLDLAGRAGLASHAAYHAGRILTYGLLGAVAGWAGGTMNLVVRFEWFSNRAALIAGSLMIVAGLLLSGVVKSNRLIQIGTSSKIARLGGRLLRSRARFVTGLVLGFLPCGLIYGALLKSVGSASPVAGAVDMLGFGLGTAGPLLGLGAFSSVIANRFRTQKLAAIGISLMGAVLVWRGLASVTPACHLHLH